MISKRWAFSLFTSAENSSVDTFFATENRLRTHLRRERELERQTFPKYIVEPANHKVFLAFIFVANVEFEDFFSYR